VCLLSALVLHDLTDQVPFEVWLAIGAQTRKPKLEYPPLRVVYFSSAALTEGIEHHYIDGVRVSVYNSAKTIADCWKYRNSIGIDIALEALQNALRQPSFNRDELWRFAAINRVQAVLYPYLEALSL
jgi:predicted transcriptional regulator of viral defense system